MSALVDGFSPITLPVFYQAVPLDIEGQGPASNEDTVSVAHEVWDNVMRTICVCGNEKTARELVSLLAELTTLQSRLEAVEAERDAILATSAAYNATEREGRAIMDEAAALARAEAAEARVEELQKALAFADEQTQKLEALLEPHIKWDPGSDLSKGGEE